MRPLVTAGELEALLASGDAVAADVRWYLDGRSGRDAYEAGHLPGAVFVELETALAAPVGDGPGRHPLPSPAVFAGAMATLGIGDDTFVVAYDDAGGSVAARLWWMLDVTGHRAAVLDGGIGAWTGPLEHGSGPAREGATFTARPWPADRIVDADAVASWPGVVLDARAAERYEGVVEPIDSRAGHMPGARSAPWSGNVDATTQRFLDAGALRARFEALGVSSVDDAGVVCYCGSGVTACHDVLALRVAGFDAGVRVYEGSWSDWSAQPGRPVAVGPDPA